MKFTMTFNTALIVASALLVPTVAFGQTVVAPDENEAPDPQPAAAEGEDAPSDVRSPDQKTPEDTKSAEREDGESTPEVPETPESAVGVGPTPGLGPAEPAVSKEEASKKTAGKIRVIDTSTKEDKEKVRKRKDKPAPLPKPKVDPESVPYTYHLRHIDLGLGFRIVGTPSDGLQPFMEEPMLVDTYLRAGGALQLTDRMALGVNGEFGGGRTSAYIRDLPSQLSKFHMSVGVEGRYHFWNRMYAYGRLAPGLEIVNASVDLLGTGDQLANPEKVGSPAFQIDGALGAAFRFAGSSDGRERVVRAWGFMEGGYRVSTKHDLELAVSEDGPSRGVPLELDPFNLSGGFFSAGLMLTF